MDNSTFSSAEGFDPMHLSANFPEEELEREFTEEASAGERGGGREERELKRRVRARL